MSTKKKPASKAALKFARALQETLPTCLCSARVFELPRQHTRADDHFVCFAENVGDSEEGAVLLSVTNLRHVWQLKAGYKEWKQHVRPPRTMHILFIRRFNTHTHTNKQLHTYIHTHTHTHTRARAHYISGATCSQRGPIGSAFCRCFCVPSRHSPLLSLPLQ